MIYRVVYQRELGFIYDNYIVSLWEGVLSITYKDTTITNILGDI